MRKVLGSAFVLSIFLMMGITPVDAPAIEGKCVGGPWGCGSTGGSGGGSSYTPPPYDDTAERQRQEFERQQALAAERKRQLELEEERLNAEREKTRKAEDFERDKEATLRSMKGVGGGELELKGIDSTVVDLRHLDPDRPITVDHNVVKGRERRISAQVSLETLNNENYKKGCQAMLNLDPETARLYYLAAQKERPGDPLVRAHILLAGDLIKLHRKTRAFEPISNGLDSIRQGDYEEALAQFKQAHAAYPQYQVLRVWKKEMEDLNGHLNQIAAIQNMTPDAKALQREAIVVAGPGIYAAIMKDYKTAAALLKEVEKAYPASDLIKGLASYADAKLKNEAAGKKGAKK